MSKIVYVCYKNPQLRDALKSSIHRIFDRITPNNITPNPAKIEDREGIIYGIFNPVNVIKEENGSVLLGGIFGDMANWWSPKVALPDGSYAIFRADDNFVEVATDAAGSRSVWYYKDDELFVASTSQRAIVAIIGKFEFNRNVLPWILSTGSLGPGNSWDSRIKLLTPDSSIILSRNTWELELNANKIQFTPKNLPDTKQEELLTDAMMHTFKGLNLDLKKWVLPLSGGYDSRGILVLLNKIGVKLTDLTAITWGLKSSLNQKGNDAFVAKKLAGFFNMPHKYYSTDLSDEPIEEVLNRFIICGEGRIDHIGGYLDGFRIWKKLYEDNVHGVIRGDVSFSEKPAISVESIRSMQGMALCSEFSNLCEYESFGLPKQQIPEHLIQQDGESITEFRDRLYHQFRIPTILAALNDLKLCYVEILNPLLSKKLLYQTRQLPDHLRTGKVLFKKIVNSLSPEVEYATDGANAEKKTILRSNAVVKLLKIELTSNDAEHIFSKSFIDYVIENLKVGNTATKRKKSFKERVIKYMPHWLLRNKALLGVSKTNVDFNVLAFRIYIILKMNKFLEEDAKVLKPEAENSVMT